MSERDRPQAPPAEQPPGFADEPSGPPEEEPEEQPAEEPDEEPNPVSVPGPPPSRGAVRHRKREIER